MNPNRCPNILMLLRQLNPLLRHFQIRSNTNHANSRSKASGNYFLTVLIILRKLRMAVGIEYHWSRGNKPEDFFTKNLKLSIDFASLSAPMTLNILSAVSGIKGTNIQAMLYIIYRVLFIIFKNSASSYFITFHGAFSSKYLSPKLISSQTLVSAS